jgi:hypothetical protein
MCRSVISPYLYFPPGQSWLHLHASLALLLAVQ